MALEAVEAGRGRAPRWPPLVVAGLTGGIASGKSTVARLFAELGATVLNADDEGRAVVEPGEPALAELIAAFGPEYLLPGGALDRRALGDRVFRSRPDLQALNRITHPRIGGRLEVKLRDLARRPPDPPVVVIEAAVLVEARWTAFVDRVVLVAAQHSTQVARLMDGKGLTTTQAEARVRAQLSLAQRRRHADHVVDGEAQPVETGRQVAAVYAELLALAAS